MDVSEKDELRNGDDTTVNYDESANNPPPDWRVSGSNPVSDSYPTENLMMETLWYDPTNVQAVGYGGFNGGGNASSSSSFRGNIDRSLEMGWSLPNLLPPKGGNGMFLPNASSFLPPSMAQFPADSGFIERAARFSLFSGGSFSEMMNQQQPLGNPESVGLFLQGQCTSNEVNVVGVAHNDASAGMKETNVRSSEQGNKQNVSEDTQSSGGKGGETSSKGFDSKKRKRNKQNAEADQSQRSQQSEEEADNNGGGDKKRNDEQSPNSQGMSRQAFLILSILLSVAVVGEGATAAYDPTDLFLFNCGATSDNTDNTGRKWTAENRQTLSSNAVNASFSSDASSQESGVPQVPYLKARIFRSDFTYSFPVSPGWKYLRLYFYPTRYESGFDAVASFFSVTVNGFTLLKNFSASLTVTASEHVLIKEFIVPVHQTLNLTFTPSANSPAFVNGIEIVSMPDGFYSKGGFDDRVINVGSDVEYRIDNTTSFETVYRLNVAGQDVGDTGMFRRWLSDDGFFLSENSGIRPVVEDVKINYTDKTPAYVAPEDVYETYRTMGNVDNAKLNMNFNLTWLFTVDAGFTYLVRLHFCETLPEVREPGQRVFSIFLRKQMAKIEMDVIQLSGGSRVPMYLDFVLVHVGSENELRTDLQVDLHPFSAISPKYLDAILNGLEILKLNDSDGNLAGPNPNSSRTPDSVTEDIQKGKKKSHSLVIITLAVVGSAILLAMFVVAVIIIKKNKKKKIELSVDNTSKPTDSSWTHLPLVTGSSHTRSATSLPSDLCRRFSIQEIKSATNNFEKELIVGVGGFGPVYKGRIDGGATLVAVKRLEISSNQGAKEFDTELEMLTMLRHIHLVSLIGYCDDEEEMVLVYEYMPHGTLRDHLYKRNKVSDGPLSWKRRLEICIGAARGLQYLHTGAKHMIIHRDIKTTNILLDENYVAKVSDFGLSKVGPTSASQTHVSTVVKGSFGYLDPEYYRRQVLTEKSDVYSFGVVLFEVVCCRPVKLENVPREETDLVRWVKSNYKKGTVDQIVDADLTADITLVSLEKFCEIAVRCVQDRGIERPSMNDVVWALEFALQLHETATNKNGVESLDLPTRDEVGATTEGEDDLFSKTTGRVSTTDDDSARLAGDEKSGSSWGVFSEIKEPKAR